MPYEGEAPAANPYLRLNPWNAAPARPYTWKVAGLPISPAAPEPVDPDPVVEPEPAVFEAANEPEAVPETVDEPDEDLFDDPIGVASFFRPGLRPGRPDPLDAEPEPEFLDETMAAPSFFRPGLRPDPAPEPAPATQPARREGQGIVTERPIAAPMDFIGSARVRPDRKPALKSEPEPVLEAAPQREITPTRPAPANFHSIALAEPQLSRANRLVLTPVVEELPPPRYAPAPRSTFEREPQPAARWAPLPLNGEADARIARRLGASGAVDPFPIVQPAPMSRRDYGITSRPKPRWPALFAGVGVVGAGALGVGAAVLLLRPHGIASAAPAAHATRTALAIEPAPDAPPPESALIAEPPVTDNAPPAIAFTPTLHRSLTRSGGRRSPGAHDASRSADRATAALSIASPPPIVLAPEPSLKTVAPAAPSPTDPIATRHDS